MSRSQSTGNPRGGPTAVVNVWKRLKEIDMFFRGKDKVHRTLKKLTQRLRKAKIPYAIMGGMAVNLHGAERTTKDVDVLMTKEGLDRFRKEFVGDVYNKVPNRARRFMDRETGTTIDVLVTGHYPGQGGPKPFAFPDPEEASEEREKLRVLTLPQLIQLKLAARRPYDWGDVMFLIRVHSLDESFKEKLHPSVRGDYIECIEENRREDEYTAREE